MKILLDYQNREVRLTDERWEHILLHAEMVDMQAQIEATVRTPEQVIRSRSDPEAELLYRFYRRTILGDKWLCVVRGGKIPQAGCVRIDRLSDGPRQVRRTVMAESVKIWFDKEGDFLEVLFSDKPGYMRETANDAVMERVDESGRLLGFSVMNVSRVADSPLVAELSGRKPAA